MKTRQGFVSNSSSCSFLVTGDLDPKQADEKLKEIIDFHNKMSGDNVKFEDVFNPSFTAKGEFAKKYQAHLLEHDYGDWKKNTIEKCGGVEGQTVIHPKVEDNEFPFSYDMVQNYVDSLYDRKDDGIEEFIK